MPKRLTLHIGSHKTGTTSFQRFMKVNQATLSQRGITYAAARHANVSEFVGPAAEDFLPLGCHLRNVEDFARLLGQSSGEHVVVSSESFSYFFHAEPVEALAALLSGLFDEVRVLAYLRRQDRHVVSHHQEGAKPHPFGAARSLWGNGLDALPAPHPRHALYLDYAHRIGLWADVFGDASVTARVFDRASLYKGDMVQDALNLLGVDPEGLEPISEQNTSLGATQAWLGHLMNEAEASANVIGQVLRGMEKGPRALPSRAEAEAFYAPWREGNARLNARLCISAEPDLFNADFHDYPETATPAWNLEAAETAIQALLRFGSMPGFSADDLREAAVALRKTDPALALRFAEAALALRPAGKGLQSLVENLSSRQGHRAARPTRPAIGPRPNQPARS